MYSQRHGNPKVTGVLASGSRLRERASNPKMARPAKRYLLYQGLRKLKNQVRGGLYIEVRNERGRGGSSMGAPKDGQKVSGEAF